MAKHFNGLEHLIFARIDASVNEHPKLEVGVSQNKLDITCVNCGKEVLLLDVQVNDYPTLLFYPADDKSNPVMTPSHNPNLYLSPLLFIDFILLMRCYFTVQIKLPTKSSLKELATLVNKHIKAQTKDEL